MLREDGQVACSGLMAIDFALIGMEIQRRVCGGMKVLCLSIVLAVAFLGCNKAMPELEPDKFVATAPGKIYEVSKEENRIRFSLKTSRAFLTISGPQDISSP